MKEKSLPLERHEALTSFSREYHHCLLLCWKIGKGLSNGVSFERIKAYADWFFENYLEPLFEAEEKYIFPVLGEEDKLIKKALSEHRRLRRLFTEEADLEKALHNIEEELDRNIRFKERELFVIIQEEADPEMLEEILRSRKELSFIENTQDEFWL